MNRLKFFVLPAVVALIAAACAVDPDDDPTAGQQALLDAWMAKYQPDATRSGNMYYYLIPGDVPGAPFVSEGDWVRLEVVGRTLGTKDNPDGDVFYNSSDSALARRLGVFSPRTYYASHKSLVDADKVVINPLTLGQIDMLTLMKQGDSCRLYLPASLAYGQTTTTTSHGYQGNTPLYAGQAAVFDMKVVEVIEVDIQTYEQAAVTRKAQEEGLTEQDTLRNDVIYFKSLDFRRLDPTDNTGEIATQDDSYYYYYTIRMLDEFVVSTNVDTVAVEAWGSTNNVSLTPAMFNKSYENVSQVLLQSTEHGELHYGEVFRLIYTSRYGYGAQGYVGSSTATTVTLIEPYTPLIMDVYIIPRVPAAAAEE